MPLAAAFVELLSPLACAASLLDDGVVAVLFDDALIRGKDVIRLDDEPRRLTTDLLILKERELNLLHARGVGALAHNLEKVRSAARSSR